MQIIMKYRQQNLQIMKKYLNKQINTKYVKFWQKITNKYIFNTISIIIKIKKYLELNKIQ